MGSNTNAPGELAGTPGRGTDAVASEASVAPPLPLWPDRALVLALAFPGRWRRRAARELRLRRGSDRSGPRRPVRLGDVVDLVVGEVIV